MNAVCRRMIHTDSTLKNILCVLAGSSVGKETVSYTCTVLRKDYNVLNSSQSISQNTKYYWYPIYLIAIHDIFFKIIPHCQFELLFPLVTFRQVAERECSAYQQSGATDSLKSFSISIHIFKFKMSNKYFQFGDVVD